MRDAKNGHYYLAQSEAEHQLLSWLQKPSIHTLPLINNLQNVVFKKHLALPTLINQLIQKFNVKCMMSGSGSACFAIIEKKNTVQGMKNMIQQAFGKEALIVETRIA